MSSSKKSILAAAVVGALAVAGVAQAATITVTPVVSGYWASEAAFNNDVNNGTRSSFSPIPAGNSAAGVYEVSFAIGTSLSAADTAAGFTGFGNLFFDAIGQGASALPAHLTAESTFGSSISDFGVKYNNAFTKFQYTDPITGLAVTGGTGQAAGNPFFAVQDQGTVGDYKGYKADLGTGVYASGDPRLNVTQSNQNATLTGVGSSASGQINLGNPLKVLDLYVVFDGSPAGTTLTPSANPATEGFGLHNNTTGLTTFFPAGTAGQSFVLNPLVFGATGTVPEPASLSLLALGGLMAVRRRRA
ncbi:MAG TPA: PEP-CTERM sorting domain-containing protein [Tepidisphaeraceae bacterium]|jgi:hypothetical protein|nr:PEP-CTERM sorting domain-containing protein [Tepidisphaeraceae bacterium]